jgi:type VI secretion system secreted protein VgrG
MQAAANGNLGAALALGPAAAGLPGASALASAIGGGPAATRRAPGEGQQAAGAVSLTGAIEAAVNSAVGGAIAKGSNALAAAAFGQGSGSSAEGAGGSSTANRGGPVGDVGGVSEADTATGPGHSQYKIDGPHTETVGSMKVTAAASSINLNVTATLTESIGAAHIEGALGDRSESVEGAKTESALGLVIVSLGDDLETAKAARANLVGGAMLDKIKGNQTVEAGAMASFIGAMHKLSASSKITLKCGASSVVIDGGGVTLTSPIVTLTGATIVHAKNVADA